MLAGIGQQYFAPFQPTGTAVAIWLSPFVATRSVRQWLTWPTPAWTSQPIRRAPNTPPPLCSPKKTPAPTSASANATSIAGAWPDWSRISRSAGR